MEQCFYLNIHITPKSAEEFNKRDSRVVACVFVNSISKTISIIDNTHLLLNNLEGLFGGVDVTDLPKYLYETKELVRCNPKYTSDDIRNAFIVTVNEYNETRTDDVKLVVR